jgi:hypothetical protein
MNTCEALTSVYREKDRKQQRSTHKRILDTLYIEAIILLDALPLFCKWVKDVKKWRPLRLDGHRLFKSTASSFRPLDHKL